MPAGRPSAIQPEMIETAGRLASACGTMNGIARGIGVHVDTVRDWLRKGEADESDSIYRRFFQSIQAGLVEAEISLTSKLQSGDGRDAAWLLSHSPFFREQWSDAAAERRAVQRTLTGVVAAIDAAGLSDDQRTRLLLTMQAQGIGVQAEGE